MGQTHSDGSILNRRQLRVHVKLAFAILVELTEREQRRAFQEEFCENTTCTEAVHRLRNLPIPLAQSLLRFALLRADLGICDLCVEPLRCNIARPTTRRVEIEGEVARIVEREECRLVWCEVGDVDPIPGGYKNVLRLDVPVRDVAVSSIA